MFFILPALVTSGAGCLMVICTLLNVVYGSGVALLKKVFTKFFIIKGCKNAIKAYNNTNRTPRTSPQKRVMCPSGGHFL